MYSRQQAFRTAEALLRSSEHPHPRQPEAPPSPSFTIALSREAGSGGTLVAREIGRRLNWPVYDHELLDHLAKELHVDVDRVESVDERRTSWLVECVEAFAAASTITEVTYFRRLLKLFSALGARGQCIIVGRGAMIALPVDTTLRVRMVASREDRVALIGRELGLDPTEAARYVESTDRERSRFIRLHFRKDLTDPLLYDLVLNASRLSVEECASIVIETLLRLQARNASVKQGLVPSRESGVERQLDQPSTLP
ncbi:MAG: cytidylate kinase-like family protein [Isosphaeraceae bacterium]